MQIYKQHKKVGKNADFFSVVGLFVEIYHSNDYINFSNKKSKQKSKLDFFLDFLDFPMVI